MNFKAAKNFGKAGTDEVPESIICQCVLYMAIFDYDQWDVAALVAGGGVRFYQIKRDLELEEIVIGKLKHFWFENVQKRIPPVLKTVEDAEILYTKGNLDPIESTPSIYKKYLERFKVKKTLCKILKKLEAIDFELKSFIGNHAELVNFNDDQLITWHKDQDSSTFDKDSFKTDHPKLFKKYLKPKTGCRRFLPKTLK
jgi:predicted phage-related endonuclease